MTPTPDIDTVIRIKVLLVSSAMVLGVLLMFMSLIVLWLTPRGCRKDHQSRGHGRRGRWF